MLGDLVTEQIDGIRALHHIWRQWFILLAADGGHVTAPVRATANLVQPPREPRKAHSPLARYALLPASRTAVKVRAVTSAAEVPLCEPEPQSHQVADAEEGMQLAFRRPFHKMIVDHIGHTALPEKGCLSPDRLEASASSSSVTGSRAHAS